MGIYSMLDCFFSPSGSEVPNEAQCSTLLAISFGPTWPLFDSGSTRRHSTQQPFRFFNNAMFSGCWSSLSPHRLDSTLFGGWAPRYVSVVKEKTSIVMERTPFQYWPQCHSKFPWTDHHQVCNPCLSPNHHNTTCKACLTLQPVSWWPSSFTNLTSTSASPGQVMSNCWWYFGSCPPTTLSSEEDHQKLTVNNYMQHIPFLQ